MKAYFYVFLSVSLFTFFVVMQQISSAISETGRESQAWLSIDGSAINREAGPKIIVENIKPNDIIVSPLVIRGKGRLVYFEASFPITLKDKNGNIVVQSYATALSDWMTEDFVPFEARIEFKVPLGATGFLEMEADNPKGDDSHRGFLSIPIRFR